jgi:FMN reductase
VTTAPTAAVVELIGSPRPHSHTRVLAGTVVGALEAAGAVTLGPRHVLDLGEIVGVTFTPKRVAGSKPVDDPFALIRVAQLVIVATPTINGTYTGLLKLFLDRLERGELVGKIAVPVAVAPSEKHLSIAAAALRRLLGELGATLPAPPLAVLAPKANGFRAAKTWATRHSPAIAKALSGQR